VGYRKVPATVEKDLARLSGAEFMVGASRDLADWDAVMGLPLAAIVDGDLLGSGSLIEYLPESGRFGRWNVNGHVLKRRDLPKVEKTYAWESRNFGRTDTSTRFRTRMVYQSELIHGRGMRLSVQATPKDSGPGYIVYVRCEFLFDRAAGVDERDVMMAASLVGEALGATPRAVSPSLSRQEWAASLVVTWSFLPPGDYTPTRIYDLVYDGHVPRASSFAREVMLDRIEMIQSTRPGQVVIGASGSDRYVGFRYRDDLVALENFTYGNALYVMYEDWETLSRKSRLELLSGGMQGFDRVVHAGKWRDTFRNLLTAHKHDSTSPPEPAS
jgi:hypothetical protein